MPEDVDERETQKKMTQGGRHRHRNFGLLQSTSQSPRAHFAMAARPQRKPQETKNLEWNSTAKKLDMLKASFLQRVGGSEGKLVPPEFTELAVKAKNLRSLLNELVDRVKQLNKSIASTSPHTFVCLSKSRRFLALLLVLPLSLLSFFPFASRIIPGHLSYRIPLFTNLAQRYFCHLQITHKPASPSALPSLSSLRSCLPMMSWVRLRHCPSSYSISEPTLTFRVGHLSSPAPALNKFQEVLNDIEMHRSAYVRSYSPLLFLTLVCQCPHMGFCGARKSSVGFYLPLSTDPKFSSLIALTLLNDAASIPSNATTTLWHSTREIVFLDRRNTTSTALFFGHITLFIPNHDDLRSFPAVTCYRRRFCWPQW